MNGQGRPKSRAWRLVAAPHLARALLAALTVCAGAAFLSAAERDDLRLRIAWGGGTAKIWEARIALSDGDLNEVRLLGLEADAAGAMTRENDAILIRPATPRTYDGVDVTAAAPLSATLTIELAVAGDPRSQQRLTLPLSKLVNETSDTALDNAGNKLVVWRAPGDRLRLRTTRSHLVFSPREKFTFEVAPYQLGLAADEVLKCEVQLLKARTQEELWRTDKDLLVAAGGELPAIGPLDVDLPAEEGAYDLLFTVRKPGLSRLLPSKVVAQRTVQLVVVDPAARQAPVGPPPTWNVVAEIDPANPKWWDRLTRISSLTLLPGFTKGPLEGGKTGKQIVGERQFIQLEPQAWQAYPLAVGTPGKPHILEVEFPAGVGQSLGISVVEPNAAGQVSPVGLDSGFELADNPSEAPNKPSMHRLVFWPKTSSPLVVLTNRRDDRPALFSHLRVLAGPEHLPPAGARPAANERLALAYYSRPLVAPNFSATDALDPAANRTLDDWITFLDSATRLAEYLRYAGYNAAVVPVYHEGGTLYPSRVLNGTAKHDTGVYFSTGQDPLQKDVAELLLRVFEREGLRLIPSLQFASPLPELELALKAPDANATGIELRDAEGKTWSERNGYRRALGPIYNPLNAQVQTAMTGVVREFADRYARHPALAGLALNLGPETFSQLPGPDWAFDDRTVAQFATETKTNVPQNPRDPFAVRAHALLGTAQPTWLAWRSANLAQFHGQLADELSKHRRDARLYILAAESLATNSVQEKLRPTLPRRASVGEALAGIGLDPSRYARRENLMFLRPTRTAPITLSRQGGAVELANSPEADAYFTQQGVQGGLHLQEPQPLRLAAFEQQSPFGAKNTYAYFVTQLTPAGPDVRRQLIHQLAAHDAQVFADGGWLLPLGQEAFLAPVLETYRRLPSGSFRAPSDALTANLAPVTLRTLERDQRTYIYLANDSPWAVTVNLTLSGSPNLTLAALGSRVLPPLVRSADGYSWQLTLEPYDLAAGVLSAPGLTLATAQTTLPPTVVNELRQQVRSVRDRAGTLREPPALLGATNFNFESPAKPPDITGWVHKRALGMSATVETVQAHGGKQALHLQSGGGVLWARSAPLALPRTGRLAVLVWLRADSPNQSPLRLAVEGRVNGQTYYRYATVAAGQGVAPLKAAWAPYVFQVDDLPYAGLTDLRVGFDLMGRGDVWVDDVTLYDLWFYKNERDELAKLVALADYQVMQGRHVECKRLLEGYWPRFLEAYVPLGDARLAALPDKGRALPAPPLPHEGEPNASGDSKGSNLMDRMRGLVPKMPSIF